MKKSIPLNTFKLLAFALIVLLLKACKPDDHDHDHDHDAITTVKILFVDSSTNTSAGEFVWSDPDGIGGNPPSKIDTITLQASKTYNATVQFFAKHDDHEDNITSDIKNEANNHLLVYKNISANVTVTILDKDGNNLPLGLNTRWVTGNASNGSVNIVLKHQVGVKDGTENPGDTDVDIVLPVVIQ
jgi:hypothetical protein